MIFFPRHPGESWGLCDYAIRAARKKPHAVFVCLFILWIPAFAGMTVFVSTVYADEKPAEQKQEKTETKPPENPNRYAPDFCDFEVTFPEKPQLAQRCMPNGKCYGLQSYTMVYDLQTTVDVSVTCNPSTPKDYKRYSQPVMKAALAGMVEDKNLKTHDVRFNDYLKEKSAALTGTGVNGTQDEIYTAQIWVGQNSIFTVQAELIGAAHPVADKSFRDILASIKIKDGKQLPPPQKSDPVKINNE